MTKTNIAKLSLQGQRFGRLVVIKKWPWRHQGHVVWLCRCDCGYLKNIRAQCLTRGDTQSCGCLQKEVARKLIIQKTPREHPMYRHGGYKTRLYRKWQGIKGRCYNPNNKDYAHYGGKGITMCDKWKNSFIIFRDWALNSGYQEHLTIDRIDSKGNYASENCRWLTASENSKKKGRILPAFLYRRRGEGD